MVIISTTIAVQSYLCPIYLITLARRKLNVSTVVIICVIIIIFGFAVLDDACRVRWLLLQSVL